MRKIIVIACLAVGIGASIGAQTEVWRHYAGALDKAIKIEADLLFSEEAISGFYFYDKVGKPIDVSGSLKPGRVAALVERDAKGAATGSMSGTFGKDFAAFSGTWKSPDGKKSYPLSLVEDYSVSAGLDAYTLLRAEAVDPEAEDSPEASFFGRVLEARGRAALQKAIEAAFYGARDGRAWQEAEASEFLADYKESVEELFGGDLDGYMYQWEREQSLAPVFNAGGILCLQASFYDYTGGAHPNGGSAYAVFDLASGKRLRLEAFVKRGSEDALADLITGIFRKDEDMSAEESLQDRGFIVERLDPFQDAFYVDGSGIYFYYPAYSIGPYALGDRSVHVSWKDLGALSAGHPLSRPR